MSIVKNAILSFSKSSSEMAAGQCQSLPFRPRVSRVCFTSASRSFQQGRNDESVDEVEETMDRAKEKTQQLKDSTEDTSNAVKDKTRQMKDSAQEKAQQMNQKTKEKLAPVADKAYEMRDKTMDAADKTKGAAEKVADAAKQTVQKIKETVVGKSDEDDYKNEDAIHNHTSRNNKKL
ncbi:hypothetical protein C2S51_005605 [Perilla frutescens var. frutescens]|nr:hypothetical protein C2S51_005605 [Perilla frutescens var. frutescens]